MAAVRDVELQRATDEHGDGCIQKSLVAKVAGRIDEMATHKQQARRAKAAAEPETPS